MSRDSFDLSRFVRAQAGENKLCPYEQVVSELRAGEKVKHWIWYIFPILRGLGKSEESAYFGLGGVDEAESYLADPVLGGRLRECTGIIIDLAPKPVSRILFGDEWKFVNCMTLFEHVSPQDLFTVGLDRCPPLSSNQTARILSRL